MIGRLLRSRRQRRGIARFSAMQDELGPALNAFLERARVRNVVDAEVLLREARRRRMDPAALLQEKAPLRAIPGRFEVLRLAAAGLRVVFRLTGFHAEPLPWVAGLCKDLEQKPEKLEDGFREGTTVAARKLTRVARGRASEAVFLTGHPEEVAATAGFLLAFEFEDAWNAGNPRPLPSREMMDLAESVVLTPAQIERLWLEAAGPQR